MNVSKDWTDLNNARMMTLGYHATTPEAHAFTHALVERLAAHDSARKTKRHGKMQDNHFAAVAAFAADLLKVAEVSRERWGYRRQSAGSFTGERITYHPYISVRDSLLSSGFMERGGFYCNRLEVDGLPLMATGTATRFRATKAFFELAASYALTPQNAEQHFSHDQPRQVLVLKAASTRHHGKKLRGTSLPLPHDQRTQYLTSQVQHLNSFLARFRLEGGIHRGYRRVYNEADSPAFNFDLGGRLYSVGDDSYQTMKKEQRLAMTLNGEQVVEIDVRASYLTLLHGLEQYAYDPTKDSYLVGDYSRAIVKAWFTATFGKTNLPRRWPTAMVASFAEKGITLPPIRLLEANILERMPVMKTWPEQRYSGFRLMHTESEAMLSAMERLMEANVPSLSVHDSLIVPVSALGAAKEAINLGYYNLTMIDPHLETNLPAPASLDMPMLQPL